MRWNDWQLRLTRGWSRLSMGGTSIQPQSPLLRPRLQMTPKAQDGRTRVWDNFVQLEKAGTCCPSLFSLDLKDRLQLNLACMLSAAHGLDVHGSGPGTGMRINVSCLHRCWLELESSGFINVGRANREGLTCTNLNMNSNRPQQHTEKLW